MKRLNKKQRSWHKHYSVWKHIREIKRAKVPYSNPGAEKEKKAEKYNVDFMDSLCSDYSFIKIWGNKIALVLPELFDLEESYEYTLLIIEVFKKINSFEEEYTSRILKHIDFNNLIYLSTSACILLTAEIDMWRKRNSGSLKVYTEKWDTNVLNQLHQVGFFELLKCPPNDKRIVDRSVINFLKFESYNAADSSINKGDLIKPIREKIENMMGTSLPEKSITNFFRAVSESILNVLYHAYPEDEEKKPWWLTSSFDSTKGELRIVFCDRGITIPKSMETSPKGRKILEKIRNTTLWNHDSHRIKKAMQEGGTSSLESHRGNGLQCFRGFINEQICGKLHIISGKGYYRFNSEDNIEYSSEKKVRLDGTIITWSVRF